MTLSHDYHPNRGQRLETQYWSSTTWTEVHRVGKGRTFGKAPEAPEWGIPTGVHTMQDASMALPKGIDHRNGGYTKKARAGHPDNTYGGMY